jgi:hypothetical protein
VGDYKKEESLVIGGIAQGFACIAFTDTGSWKRCLLVMRSSPEVIDMLVCFLKFMRRESAATEAERRDLRKNVA